jgi:hypothetical protein
MRYGMHLLTHVIRQGEWKFFPFNSKPKEDWTEGFLEHDILIADMKRWCTAFEVLSKILYSNGGSIMVSAAVLKIHLTTLYLCLVDTSQVGEMIYDEYPDEFGEIVNLAEMVLRAGAMNVTRFCFDLGVIVSLQFTSQKCRCTGIRRKAIALLLESPRREGAWDSLFAGRMMECAADVEEEFMKDGHVPGWARIRGVQHQYCTPYLQ